MLAALRGDAEMMKALREKGADFSLKHDDEKFNETVLHCAAQGGSAECVRLCLEEGLDPEEPGPAEERPLHYAAKRKALEILKVLVEEKKVDMNCREEQGLTPLHFLARENATECLAYLLSQGADKDAKDFKGSTPLMIAVTNANVNDAKILLEAGASADALKLFSNVLDNYGVGNDIFELLMRYSYRLFHPSKKEIQDSVESITNKCKIFRWVKESDDPVIDRGKRPHFEGLGMYVQLEILTADDETSDEVARCLLNEFNKDKYYYDELSTFLSKEEQGIFLAAEKSRTALVKFLSKKLFELLPKYLNQIGVDPARRQLEMLGKILNDINTDPGSEKYLRLVRAGFDDRFKFLDRNGASFTSAAAQDDNDA